MADLIQGQVSYVMDRRTFAIVVTHVGARNADTYLKEETVRIRHLYDPDRQLIQTGSNKKELEQVLGDRSVRCRIDHRDSYHRIVADVHLVALSAVSTSEKNSSS